MARNGRAARGEVGLQLLEVFGEVVQRLVLGLRTSDPQLLPVLHLGDDRGALVADGAGGVGEVAAQLGVGQRLAGAAAA